MNHAESSALEQEMPSRFSSILFRFKATCFQLRRTFRNQIHPVRKHLTGTELDSALPLTEWKSDLWREGTSPREVELQRGKVQNLRVAAQTLQSISIPADAVWSFWQQLGRTTVGKGYAVGRELREGCLVPMIGGITIPSGNVEALSTALDRVMSDH